jgi:hypothetical protein
MHQKKIAITGWTALGGLALTAACGSSSINDPHQTSIVPAPPALPLAVATSGGAAPGAGVMAPELTGDGANIIDLGTPVPSGGACRGLTCQQTTCANGGRTRISGTVYAPSGELPLYNVMVYIPNAPLAPLSSGANCACEISGDPIVSALTDTEGRFVLDDAPSGSSIPIVIQIGKWRRLFTLDTVTECAETPVVEGLLKLPARQADGDMPRIAVTTGGADALECLIGKLGIDPVEITNPEGGGRINFFAGRDGTAHYSASVNAGAPFPSAEVLWTSLDGLRPYDVVLLSCEGQPGFVENKAASAFPAMHDYLNLGGRVFASHYQHVWLEDGPSPLPDVAQFVAENDIGEVTADVVTTFPKGQALAEWLVNVQASPVAGKIALTGTQHSVASENPLYAQRWIATADPASVQYLSANTPLGAPDGEQCGRVILSDIHIAGAGDDGEDRSAPDLTFPDGCQSQGLTPQEKVLAYMLFDISACIVPDNEPPRPPPLIR